MLQALNMHAAERPLLIRLCFILGNLCASSTANREVTARVALPLLLRLLQQHAAYAAKAHHSVAATKVSDPDAAPAAVEPRLAQSSSTVGVQAGGEIADSA